MGVCIPGIGFSEAFGVQQNNIKETEVEPRSLLPGVTYGQPSSVPGELETTKDKEITCTTNCNVDGYVTVCFFIFTNIRD